MENGPRNKLTMYIVLLAYLDATNLIWNGLVAMVANVLKFRNVILQIQGTQAIADRILKGHTVTLAGVQKEMQDETMKIIAAVKSFAMSSTIPNMTLWGSVNFNLTTLKEGGNVLLNGRCLNIYLIANGIGLPLADHGVGTIELGAQHILIAQHLVLIPTHRVQGGVSKAANSDLVDEFHQADFILKNGLVNNALQFKKSQNNWFKGFNNAKTIFDLGHHITSFHLLVINAITLQLMKGVKVVITGYPGGITDFLTGKTGKLDLAPAHPGIYVTVIISKTGFITQTFTNVQFTEAKALAMTVALVPAP